jgi:hypothetical protein
MTKLTNHNGKFEIFETIDAFADRFEPVGRYQRAQPWSGNMDGWDMVKAARNGHDPSVALSEQYLDKFEELSFQARKHNTVDAVAGGAPNVGAYLAGSPLSMRRRQRMMNDFAPLTVFCDVVSSASISPEYLKKRGAAALALVRMLSATRPVTLYVVGGMGAYSWRRYASASSNGFVMVKMPETIDIARMAFMMAHPAAMRGMLYKVCCLVNPEVRGHWAFSNVDTYRSRGLRLYAEAVNANVDDCLYIPPPFHNEETAVVEQWLKDMLAKYGAASVE